MNVQLPLPLESAPDSGTENSPPIARLRAHLHTQGRSLIACLKFVADDAGTAAGHMLIDEARRASGWSRAIDRRVAWVCALLTLEHLDSEDDVISTRDLFDDIDGEAVHACCWHFDVLADLQHAAARNGLINTEARPVDSEGRCRRRRHGPGAGADEQPAHGLTVALPGATLVGRVRVSELLTPSTSRAQCAEAPARAAPWRPGKAFGPPPSPIHDKGSPMLHQTHSPDPHADASSSSFDEPRSSLRAGDIVMCKFPSVEARAALEKSRPCLVLDVTDDELVLAYGTTRDGHVRRSRELHVLRVEDLAAAGLWRPTRFLGWRTVRLPRDSDRLGPAPDGGTICGHLSGRYRRGLAQMRALACPDPALPAGRCPHRRNRPAFLGGAIR